jgi:hypothetical protein
MYKPGLAGLLLPKALAPFVFVEVKVLSVLLPDKNPNIKFDVPPVVVAIFVLTLVSMVNIHGLGLLLEMVL